MNNINLCDIWKFIRKYNFEKQNQISNDFLCWICKRIIVNPHITQCECRFCFDCISNYLSGKSKSCPGNTIYCRSMKLCHSNILPDQEMSMQIVKLSVNCPNEPCTFKSELIKVKDHVEICDFRNSCFNIGYGAVKDSAYDLQLQLSTHTNNLMECIDNLNNEIYTVKNSFRDLKEENENLKKEIDEVKLNKNKINSFGSQFNDINLMSINITNLNDGIDLLKLDKEKQNMTIQKLLTEMNEINRENQRLQEKLHQLESKITTPNTDSMSRDNDEIKTVRNSDLVESMNKLKLDGDTKKNIIQNFPSMCDEQIREIQYVNQDIVTLKNAEKDLRNNVDELKIDKDMKQLVISALEVKSEKNKYMYEQIINNCERIENKNEKMFEECKNELKRLMESVNEMKNKEFKMTLLTLKHEVIFKLLNDRLFQLEICFSKLNSVEFIWKIENFNDKLKDAKNGINTKIFSDSFYSCKNGYKMCLSICPHGEKVGKSTHLSVHFYLMQGDYDNVLEWPFKKIVRFGLINQKTLHSDLNTVIIYKPFANDCNRNRPNSERNVGFGSLKFIELDGLLNNEELIHDNQIFIKCIVFNML